MRKILFNIYLMFVLLILFSCKNVNAAEELTCIYNKATTTKEAYEGPILVHQDENGNLSFKQHTTTNNIGNFADSGSPGWNNISFGAIYYNSSDSEISTGNFNKCPTSLTTKYETFKPGPGIFSDHGNVVYLYDSSEGRHSFYKEEHEPLDEGNYKSQSGLCKNSLPDDANSTWLNKCTYKYVTIYFNESNWYQVCSDTSFDTYLTLDTTFNNYYKMYKNLGGKCPNLKASFVNSGSNFDTGRNYTNVTYQLTMHDGDLISSEINDPNPPELGSEIETDLPEITECTDLLGDPGTPGAPAYYLSKAFHVIKYVALALLIVLSVMDFTSAVAKQDKDVMAKVLRKLMMRFILCIIIFLLPYLIDLLLKYLVERQTDLCGVK